MGSLTSQSARGGKVPLVGAYVPRQCGIAAFTKDLRDAIAAQVGQQEAWAVALDDIAQSHPYPEERCGTVCPWLMRRHLRRKSPRAPDAG